MKYLLDEYPLIILPSLAVKVGLNESIILQQLHYWLEKSSQVRDGYVWIYNTYEDWKKQFPFWSVMTIRRTISKLENEGYIITGNYNKLKIDNTKWYRIDYEKLEGMNRPSVQNEQTECSKRTDEVINLNRPLPEITSDTTTKTTKKERYADYVSMTPAEYQLLIDKLGESKAQDMIDALNLWKGSKGKKTNSDYMTILNWVRKEKKERESIQVSGRQPLRTELDQLSL